jgi:hypothetical protein
MSMKNHNDNIGNQTRDVKSRDNVKTGSLFLPLEHADSLFVDV